MNETLANFRQAVADSADLQRKSKRRCWCRPCSVKKTVTSSLKKNWKSGWEELQKSDEELTAFELDVVAGGIRMYGRC